MKKFILMMSAFIVIASTGFAQEKTVTKTTTGTHHKSTKHKRSKKHHTASKHHSDMNAGKPSEGATMNPRSGSNTNGAGKSAKIQTTTKEKSDNLNDMDKSRN